MMGKLCLRGGGKKKKSGATPCGPDTHTKTLTKAAQLVLAETFYTKQSREREGQRG